MLVKNPGKQDAEMFWSLAVAYGDIPGDRCNLRIYKLESRVQTSRHGTVSMLSPRPASSSVFFSLVFVVVVVNKMQRSFCL